MMLTADQISHIQSAVTADLDALFPKDGDKVTLHRREAALGALPTIMIALQEYDRICSEKTNPPAP